MSNKSVCKQLTAHHKLPARTFGLDKKRVGSNDWIFRRLITNIIVGASLEENVLKASQAIFAKFPTIGDLAQANDNTITGILQKHSVRFAERKANYVLTTTRIILVDYKSKVPSERAALESFPGVGRHVASIVIALAFKQPAFAVDLHVRRIAKRLGLVDEDATDLQIEQALTTDISPKQHGRYSRAFVDFGKTICSKTPNCGECYMQEECSNKQAPAKQVETAMAGDGVYEIVAGSSAIPYNVTVTAGKKSCNCKGFRFRRTCSHVKAVN